MEVFDRLDRQYQMYADEYKSAAIEALDSACYIMGSHVEKFEKDFASLYSVRHCIGVNSGLDALQLSIRALGFHESDEIIVPANTFIASVLAITENGVSPVFVEPDEFHNIDANKIENAITRNTKAIMVVHLYGQAANMEKIKDIADRYHLEIIEDCAQSHGAKFNGKLTGTWGIAGCFSFYPTKVLGGFGDGGAIITNDDGLADKLRKIRNYGSGIKYHNEVKGVNSRLDDIQAALLNVKLGHLSELIEQRQKYAKSYISKIQNKRIELPRKMELSDHIYYLFVIRCKERNELQSYLQKNGIRTMIHYPIPPHLQECYNYLGYKTGDFPITENEANTVLSLPFFNGMTDEEIEFVVNTINRF